ncbi:MAG: ABC transporter permease [Anaerolineaceae bacterium]|nr:ABC transporter permease [Anaerolineaceae bacterium]
MEEGRTLLDILVAASGLTLAAAAPFLYAALGELFAQRSGVLNLGVEGIMLMGAFTSVYVISDKGFGAHPLVGLLVAMLVGGLLGLLMAVVSVTLQAEQGISGIGLTLFGQGMSTLLFRVLAGGVIVAGGVEKLSIPLLSELPIVGSVFFRQDILTYGAFALVPISVWILNRTSWGLQVRAVGQNPRAADAMGVNVARVRYQTVILGGVLAGVAGATLSMALTGVFQENMTAGRGFIAVALVYFGGWSPWKVMAGALLFSAANNLQIWVQVLDVRINDASIPPNLLIMMPYVLTIVVLIFARERQKREPAALTKPFERGEN